MRTITLPIIVVAFVLFAIFLSYKLIVNRRCRVLKKVLLQNCKELFDTIGELRGLGARMKQLEYGALSGYILELDDIAEMERKITARLKNTVQDAL